jgi:hypothetical protein
MEITPPLCEAAPYGLAVYFQKKPSIAESGFLCMHPPVMIALEFFVFGFSAQDRQKKTSSGTGRRGKRMHTRMMAVAIFGMALAMSCSAQNAPGGAPGGASGGHSPNDVQLKGDKFFAQIDTNKDGKLSKEEWKAQGLPDGVFTRMDTDKDNFLTLKEVEANWYPGELDSNKDGILTVEKMKAFDAKMKNMKAPGGAGGPGGGAPDGAQK